MRPIICFIKAQGLWVCAQGLWRVWMEEGAWVKYHLSLCTVWYFACIFSFDFICSVYFYLLNLSHITLASSPGHLRSEFFATLPTPILDYQITYFFPTGTNTAASLLAFWLLFMQPPHSCQGTVCTLGKGTFLQLKPPTASTTLGFRCPYHTCLSFQPHAAPSNPPHPISATLGLLSILWLCQTLSHFRDFARVVLLLRTVSSPSSSKAWPASFLSHVSSNVTPWGKVLLTKLWKQPLSSPYLPITHYPILFLFVSVFVVCVCCLVSWFPTRIKVHKDKEFAWCCLSMHSQSLGLAQ